MADVSADSAAADRNVELAACLRAGRGCTAGGREGARTSLIGADLSGEDLTGCNLSFANLTRANLSGAKLARVDLRGANLFGANLSEAELLGADLTDADLSECVAERAGFGSARLRGSKLFGAGLSVASFTQADLRGADLRAARLDGARLREADLRGADLSRAVLSGADLDGCQVAGARFVDTVLRKARVRRIAGYDRAYWIGADILDVDFTNAYLARRTIRDQNYLEEFRTRSRLNAVLYRVWWATSDCGRSFARWGLWTLLIALVFAGLYETVEVDYGEHRTFLSSIYYSVVTLTTLGYGDVVPASTGAQAVAMIEVAIGYVMLGGLLSIFSNKMARRAD